MDAEQFYNQHLSIIGQIASSVCRRNGLNEHDAEDFTSDIRLKLCDDDYAVIRKFQGKSNFTTYLTVVINKAFVDHRRRVWGKWTPSSQAKRFGDTVVALGDYGGTYKATGKSFSAPFAHVWTLHDGKILRFSAIHRHRRRPGSSALI